ncbi:V-type ATP synthase subunit I, partial [Enterococcus faecalis]
EVLLAVIPKEKTPQQFFNASSFFILPTWGPVEEKTAIFTAIEEKDPKDEKTLTFLNPTQAENEKEIPL